MKLTKLLAIAFCGVCLVASCGDDDPDPTPNPGPDPGPKPEITINDNSGDGTGSIAGNAKAPEAQQAYMQQVGKEFLGYVNADEFTYWRDLANHINNRYVDNDRFDNDIVEDWFEDIVEDGIKIGSSQEEDEYYYDWDNTLYKHIYKYTDYKKLVLLSNIHGKFTAGVRNWTKEQANNLQFIFTDQNGQQAVASLNHSGNTKTVHVVNIEDWDDYSWTQEGNVYISTEFIDKDHYYIEIPEKIIFTYTAGGQERIRTEVTLDLSSIGDHFDLNRNNFGAKANVKFDQYTVDTRQIAYSPNSKATAQVVVAKGSAVLVIGSAEAGSWKLTGAGDNVAEAGEWDDDDLDFTGGAGKMRLNVLGKMQLNCVVTDARKFADAVDKADENDWGGAEKEAPFKAAVREMNQYLKAGLYYDGKPEKQADFRFEPFGEKYKNWENSWTYEWEYHPVIVFANGTNYSLLEESDFFNEGAFKSLVDLFEDLCDDFEDLGDGLDI